MRRWWAAMLGVFMLGAVVGEAGAQATGTYTGDVWVWDSGNNIVTLRQGTQTIRVKITPDQMLNARLHDRVTVRGQLVPNEDIAHVTAATRIVGPRDPADEMDLPGTVAAVDTAGVMTVTVDGAQIRVWTAAPGGSQFRAGDTVRVRLRVQALALDTTPGPAWRPEPVVAQPGVAGEYAAMVGSVTAVDASGRLSVSSQRGPVEVLVRARDRYKPGDMVEVRTAVQAAR